MKTEEQSITIIRDLFSKMHSKEDLASLLNEANRILYDKESKLVSVGTISFFANPNLCKKRYQRFSIRKKSGGERAIHAPVGGLKSILRTLNFVIQCVYEPQAQATGFVLNKSIVDNAKLHLRKPFILNLDLKDFFHSFDRNRVKLGFMQEPFNLKGNKEPLAFLLACLATHPIEIEGEFKTVLPQGSPTSPALTNLLCRRLDRRLNGLAKRFNANYSRYADDITFSSFHNLIKSKDFNTELHRIIEIDQKLSINPKKTRLIKADYRQEVTGLIVNEKVNVRRRYVKQVRMWLYYWERYGFSKANQLFVKDYLGDKSQAKNDSANMIHVIDGKIEFIRMVKGSQDLTYEKLKIRFERLMNHSKAPSVDKLNIESVYNAFFNEGFEEGFKLFNKYKRHNET